MSVSSHSAYLPGLSIIRTLAAISVLFGHMWQFGEWGVDIKVHLPEIYLPVTTFFVISGFLITWHLLREQDTAGDINILNAYKRRALRILPQYYLGIIVGVIALWMLRGSFSGKWSLLLLLAPNISHVMGGTPFPFYHYWTIGVEVVFYLFFPWIIKYGRKYLLQIVTSIILVWMCLRVTTYIFDRDMLYRFVGTLQFDTILLGAMGAILFYEGREWLQYLCESKWFVLISWLLFLTSNLWAVLLPAIIRADMIALVSLSVILSGFYGHPILENKFTQYIGKISYGIYIFHPIVIYVCSTLWGQCRILVTPTHYTGYLVSAIVLVLSIAVAALSPIILRRPLRRGSPQNIVL